MVKALNNYMIDQFRKSPPPALDVDEHLDAAETPDASGEFDVAWARQVLSETYDHMRAECEAAGRLHIWQIFAERVITPTLTGTKPPSYDVLGETYGFRSPKEAGNVFISGRRMFERVLRMVIGQYARDEDETDAEINDLLAALAGAGSYEG